MSTKILVISQYYYPEQFRINDMCQEWVNRGYEVTVVTGIPNYPKGKFYKGYGLFKNRKEVINGVRVLRLPIIPRGKGKITLFLNYISFVISGYFWKIFTKVKADYTFIFEVSPMTQALPGVWYSKKKGIPCYIYVQDLWPENVEVILGVKNKFIIRSITRMVNYIYKNCENVFVTSNSFRNNLISKGLSVNKVVTWSQYAEDYHIELENDNNFTLEQNFNIIYTGNIGKAQGLEVIIPTALKLKEMGIENVIFHLVGDGRELESLKKSVSESELHDNVKFHTPVLPDQVSRILSEADVALLTLESNKVFDMTIPAKLQTYLACGVPVLAVARGEVAEIVQTAKVGYCSSPADLDGLVGNIVRIMKLSNDEMLSLRKAAKQFQKNNFDKTKLMNEIDKYFR